MHKRFVALLIGLAVVVSLGPSAQAVKGGRSAVKRAYQFHGTVESVADDGDPLTPDSIAMLIEKTNGNGKRLGIVNGTSVRATMAVNGATRYIGEAAGLADLASGDPIKVTARYDGAGFVARCVKEKDPAAPSA
jgi:hypothetical protein